MIFGSFVENNDFRLIRRASIIMTCESPFNDEIGGIDVFPLLFLVCQPYEPG